MDQLVWFLGRFHVLVLHLPLGILTLAAALEVLSRFDRFKALGAGLAPLWTAGALGAIVTVVLGFMHASEDAFRAIPAVAAHRRAGVALCVAACVVAMWRWRQRRSYERLWAAPVALVTVLMVLTGHLGGALTHGDRFLVQYAPAPIRRLAGLPDAAAPRPKPRDLASVDLFLDVVQPALHSRCATCHNRSKHSGGLSVESYETLMKGGSTGPVISAGNSSRSDLFRRITLPHDAEDFMPREGKTPLDERQVTAIGWWIDQGAPASAAVGSLEADAKATAAVASLVGLTVGEAREAAAGAASEATALPDVPEADAASIARVVDAGFIVRKISLDSTLLDVDYTSPRSLTPEGLADLAKLAPNVLHLNLRRAGLTDTQMSALAGFGNLRTLRLERNDITDAGARELEKLTALTTLNLTSTRITDAGLDAVARLPRLRALYVWGTRVTPRAAAKLAAERTDLRLELGLSAREVPPAGKVVPPDF